MNYRKKYFESAGLYENNNGWYTCEKCGRKFRKGDMDIDHIVPQKYGGNDSMINLQCICKHCNRSKKASLSDTPKDLINSTARELRQRKREQRQYRRLLSEEDEMDDSAIKQTMRNSRRR